MSDAAASGEQSILVVDDEPAIRQIRDGTTLSLSHPLEVELSERLVEIIPCAEMVRFGKNGTGNDWPGWPRRSPRR